MNPLEQILKKHHLSDYGYAPTDVFIQAAMEYLLGFEIIRVDEGVYMAGRRKVGATDDDLRGHENSPFENRFPHAHLYYGRRNVHVILNDPTKGPLIQQHMDEVSYTDPCIADLVHSSPMCPDEAIELILQFLGDEFSNGTPGQYQNEQTGAVVSLVPMDMSVRSSHIELRWRGQTVPLELVKGDYFAQRKKIEDTLDTYLGH